MIFGKVVENYVFFICAKSQHCSCKSMSQGYFSSCFPLFVCARELCY